VVAWSAALGAQEPRLSVTFTGGRATDLRGAKGDAIQIAPALSIFPSRQLVLSFAGRGTRFSTDDWSIAGAVSAGSRLPVGRRLALSLVLSGDATRASFGATYLLAEAVPALELRTGPVLFWGGVRGAAGRRTLTPSSSLHLPSDSPPLERSTLGPAFGLAFDLVDENGSTTRLMYREEHGRPAGGPVADRVATVVLTSGVWSLSGAVGLRSEAGGTHAYGGGRIGVGLGRSLSMFLGFDRYPANLLLDSPAGRTVAAGVTIGTGAGATRRNGPAPARVPPPAPGETRLTIKAGDAERVDVAGDWNQWTPVPLQRASNGVWYVDLSIPPGRYRHAFRINGRSWRIPEGVAAVNDGFGGTSAWLSVPKRAPAQ
jgi:hypothetical protein